MYDAWGNILSQTGTIASSNPYRYASYRFDEVTGLYYLKARYYDSDTGRFITRDTFHGFEDDPKSLNQYAYAHGNPVRYVDHDGNWVWLVFNAAMATYDGYKAYKKAYAEGKRGWKLASAVAWAVAGNFIKVGKITKYLNIAKAVNPVYGRKFDYLFGKATGSKHNIDRSRGMLRQLQSIGLFDTKNNRAYVQKVFTKAFKDPKNGTVLSNGRVQKEFTLAGPRGVVKVESIWERNNLITMKLYGGR